MNAKKMLAAAAITGMLAVGAIAPMAAFAQSSDMNMSGNAIVPVPATTNNFIGLPSYGGGLFGGGYGYGSNLGSLFVLDRLFSGPNGNGILSPYGGTSLGDLFILGQLFGNNGYNGYW